MTLERQKARLRCAICTRVSSDAGLEQDFDFSSEEEGRRRDLVAASLQVGANAEPNQNLFVSHPRSRKSGRSIRMTLSLGVHVPALRKPRWRGSASARALHQAPGQTCHALVRAMARIGRGRRFRLELNSADPIRSFPRAVSTLVVLGRRSAPASASRSRRPGNGIRGPRLAGEFSGERVRTGGNWFADRDTCEPSTTAKTRADFTESSRARPSLIRLCAASSRSEAASSVLKLASLRARARVSTLPLPAP